MQTSLDTNIIIIQYYYNSIMPHQKISLPDAKNRIWTKIAILLQKRNAYAIQLRIPLDYQ
jgi:hypothetical protein